jgi:hypothetical protein
MCREGQAITALLPLVRQWSAETSLTTISNYTRYNCQNPLQHAIFSHIEKINIYKKQKEIMHGIKIA